MQRHLQDLTHQLGYLYKLVYVKNLIELQQQAQLVLDGIHVARKVGAKELIRLRRTVVSARGCGARV